ncbi:bifunctional metallophosphatase/5'-nucleotidase [Paenibacillus athensensis]|uniref:Bifunctional metallophosphatase/5'-nucleotidase n=1 Tax=Paenibacillus athensensis TaxID=1967502 RepID=A0A4Y8PZ68_9BACL|nr:bifunctional UDP-sugar hydrolase/5'-nucleotidase [Paenibacillus athensensis]MCD1259338.1 bifunctional metallophosphatase/5'-nucleotidase [Paenibacillus athensensis]
MKEWTTVTACTVTFLETSDVHGAMLPIHYADNRPQELGLAKIATLLRLERARQPHAIYVDNGDLIQGTPLAYHHARLCNEPVNPLVLGLNELKCDAAVLGNHEFNYGLDALRKAVGESRFPWLSATVVDETTGEPLFGTPYIVRELPEGVRVGLLGLTTPYIPNWENPDHIRGLRFIDAVEAAQTWVPVLREQERVDVVAVAYHGGFERDLASGEPTEPQTGENQGYRLCMEVPGIDVLLTGHQHRSLAGVELNGVAIVQPASQGAYLGKAQLQLARTEPDGAWRVVGRTTELLPAAGAEADAEIMQLAAPYEARTQAWLDQPIGRLTGNMRVTDPLQIRLKDNALIEFINRVQMELSGADISNTALFDNRSPGFPEQITMRDIVSNYIYPNTLKVIRISGRDIRAALEQSAAYFELAGDGSIRVNPRFAEPKPQHYNYDMWEGIEYRLNIARPFGQRVDKLLYRGRPIDPDAEFDVVMNNYRAGGGGNFLMFKNKPVIRDIPTDMSELIAAYIMERGVIEARVDHNWEVVAEPEELK